MIDKKNTRSIATLTLMFVLFFIFILLFSSGCNKDPFANLTPREAILKANKTLLSLKGYRLQVKTKIKTKKTQEELEFAGISINSDFLYLKGVFNNLTIEVLQTKNSFYIKHPLTGKWLSQQAFQFGNFNSVLQSPHETLKAIKNYIKKAKYVGEEELNGIPVKIVEYEADSFELISLFDNANTKLLENIYDKINYTAKVWIGKDNFYIHKMAINIDIYLKKGEKQSISSVVTIFDHNKKIKIPKEIQEFTNQL